MIEILPRFWGKIPCLKFRSVTDKNKIIYGLSFDSSELSTANPLCSP